MSAGLMMNLILEATQSNEMLPLKLMHTTHPIVLVMAAFFFIAVVNQLFIAPKNHVASFLSTQPWAIPQRSFTPWLTWLRGTLLSVSQSKVMTDFGYRKYSKFNKFFVQPSIDRGAFVMVPPVQLKRIYDLPESQLDVMHAQNENVQLEYTIGNRKIYEIRTHVNVIRNQLTRTLQASSEMMAEEIEKGLVLGWGLSSAWKTIKLWPSALKIISSTSNRVFIGLPHCRDEVLTDQFLSNAKWMFTAATLINMTPAFFRPIVGYFFKGCFPILRRPCLKRLEPLVSQRLQSFREKVKDPSQGPDLPQDAIQWLIEEAHKLKAPEQMTPHYISQRLMIMNFVSLHTTSFTFTNALLDVCSSKYASDILEDAREEAERVFNEAGRVWTRAAVEKLYRIDSIIKESMRVSTFGIVALIRKVACPHGIETDGNVRIPKDTYLACPMDAIHLDESHYTNAREYHPFRFCTRAQIEGTRMAAKQSNYVSRENGKQKSTASLDDAFLSFGFGRYACPGRFFAIHEIKISLAIALMEYDIQSIKQKPPPMRVLWIQLPREDSTLVIRRKRETGLM